MNESQVAFFREYDQKARALITPREAELFSWLLSGSGWNDSISDTPGYFPRGRKPAHRCLWSCRWATGMGILGPEKYKRLDCMTHKELLLEASDILNRSTHPDIELLHLVLEFYTDAVGGAEYWLDQMRQRVGQARNAYGDFLCPWSMPDSDKLMQRVLRPSWGV